MRFSRKMLDAATTSGVQVNKYARMGLSAIVAIVGFLMAVDWTTILEPKTAGTVMGIIGVLKFVYAYLAPAPGVPTQPVGSGTGIISSQGTPPGPIVETHVGG